jgi:hypothetical protein
VIRAAAAAPQNLAAPGTVYFAAEGRGDESAVNPAG